MKKIVYIILLLVILFLGINIGSANNDTKADIIKDKIERIFERINFLHGFLKNNNPKQ